MSTIVQTPPGLPVVLLELAAHGDARGRFMETFRRDHYRDLGVGLGVEFVQDNFSSSARGTLRGLHYQLQRPQGKLVWVTRGAIWDVAIDIRLGSPTYGEWFGTELSADNHRQLWIPPGFAHGFVAISDVDVAYKVTDYYVADDERSIVWNDPDLAISWPMQPLVVSHRDTTAPRLRDAQLPPYWAGGGGLR